MHQALIDIARDWLAAAAARPPGDGLASVEIRRATSNADYALFHAIAAEAADLLAGPGSAHWARVYRSPEHTRCKAECLNIGRAQSGHPGPIRACANSFVSLQAERHRADCDPAWKGSVADALVLVDDAENAILSLSSCQESERRAFVQRLLFPERR